MTYLGLHDAAGAPLLVLDAQGGGDGPFLVTKVDLGAADVNEDTEPNPAGDGIRDYTSTTGASLVVVELTALGDATAGPQTWLGKLRGLCHPRRRLYLHVGIDEWPDVRRMLVRGMPATRDLTDVLPDAQFQWKAIEGYLESVEVFSVTLTPTGTAMGGIAEPIHFPVAFPAANPSGGAPFTVGGDFTARPWFDIYGPCTAPVIENDAGEVIAFKPSFVIAAGHFVRVNPNGPGGAPLVAGDGDIGQQLYGRIDFTATTPDLGLTLEPGDNRLTFTANDAGAGCQAIASWRTRY